MMNSGPTTDSVDRRLSDLAILASIERAEHDAKVARGSFDRKNSFYSDIERRIDSLLDYRQEIPKMFNYSY